MAGAESRYRGPISHRNVPWASGIKKMDRIGSEIDGRIDSHSTCVWSFLLAFGLYGDFFHPNFLRFSSKGDSSIYW